MPRIQTRRKVFKSTSILLQTLKKHPEILRDLLNQCSKSTGNCSLSPRGIQPVPKAFQGSGVEKVDENYDPICLRVFAISNRINSDGKIVHNFIDPDLHSAMLLKGMY